MVKGEPRIRFHLEWLEYIQTLPKEEQVALFDAITLYGFCRRMPSGLTEGTRKYFRENIRPELDRQYSRRKEGKKP